MRNFTDGYMTSVQMKHCVKNCQIRKDDAGQRRAARIMKSRGLKVNVHTINSGIAKDTIFKAHLHHENGEFADYLRHVERRHLVRGRTSLPLEVNALADNCCGVMETKDIVRRR